MLDTITILEDSAKYRGIWAACLYQAVRDFQKIRGKALIKSSAATWLFSENTKPGTFLWVCSVLDLNPTNARLQLQKPVSESPKPQKIAQYPALNLTNIPEFFTTKELAERYDVPTTVVKNYIRNWRRAGEVIFYTSHLVNRFKVYTYQKVLKNPL